MHAELPEQELVLGLEPGAGGVVEGQRHQLPPPPPAVVGDRDVVLAPYHVELLVEATRGSSSSTGVIRT